jgi:hypothetical protein
MSLREALKSPLFARLRELKMPNKAHSGGCVLFENRETVERLARTYVFDEKNTAAGSTLPANS